jgi:S-adenosyl-L-methionine hydrolase (adenosine-forming)
MGRLLSSCLLTPVRMPVIALLTDFGTRDHYVGTMKGVILGIAPAAAIVDITHEVDAQDVLGGALQLSAAYRYFPSGTIFVAVVDPGVGSARRGLGAEAGGYLFVAPDNGVLSAVVAETPPIRLVELTERRYALEAVSRTFEGRDRFAPAAAWLAAGVDLAALGPAMSDLTRLDIPEPVSSEGELRGVVLLCDRFGNLVTNVTRRAFEAFASGGPVEVVAAGRAVGRMVSSYAEIPPGEVGALFGSSDRLELAASCASAAVLRGLGRGAAIAIRRTA